MRQPAHRLHGFGAVAATGNQLTSDGLPSCRAVRASNRRDGTRSASTLAQVLPATRSSVRPKAQLPSSTADDTAVAARVSRPSPATAASVGNTEQAPVRDQDSTDLFFSSQTNGPRRSSTATRCCAWPRLLLPDARAVHTPGGRRYGRASTDKRLDVVDAYTTTTTPYAQHGSLSDATVDPVRADGQYVRKQQDRHYMRNSVKRPDAYDGSDAICSARTRRIRSPAYLGRSAPASNPHVRYLRRA